MTQAFSSSSKLIGRRVGVSHFYGTINIPLSISNVIELTSKVPLFVFLRPFVADSGLSEAGFKTSVHEVVKNIFMVLSDYSYNSPKKHSFINV
jgi:hypothetical protein